MNSFNFIDPITHFYNQSTESLCDSPNVRINVKETLTTHILISRIHIALHTLKGQSAFYYANRYL